jgi:hypothetical protein
MELLSPNRFSLRIAIPASDTELARSEILLNGRASGTVVEGAVLEAAIQWREFVLAFLTDDIPSEDSLRIYLFDDHLKIVDSAWIGAMYSTGSFRQLELSEPNMVAFSFIGGTRWTVELLDREIVTVPFVGEPKGVHRPFSLHRHFRVRAEPVSGATVAGGVGR